MPSFVFKDLSEVAAFANDTSSRLDEILNAVRQVQSPPVQQVNAAGTRTVTTEQTAPAPPAPAAPAPTLPVAPAPAVTTFTDTESANALRLMLGTDFSSLTDFIPDQTHNTYVPDFRLFCHVLNEMCEVIQTTRHFYTASQHWHPILCQAYYVTAALIFTLDVQVQAGHGTYHDLVLINSLKQQFDYNTITIPGPLVPFFIALSSGRTNVANQEITISPSLDTVTNASVHSFGLPASALDNTAAITTASPRLPSVLALLDQYVLLLNVGTAAALTDYHNFGVNILGVAACTPGANPNYADNFPVVATLSDLQKEVFRSPGFNNIITVSTSIAGNLVPARHRIAAIFPTRAQLAAASATSIDEYCALDIRYGQWFNRSSPIMSTFCRFFKASRPLATISPVGSACGQVEYRYHGTAITAAPTTRFESIPTTLFSGMTRSKNVSPADDLDSAVTQWNTDSYINVAASHRTGPFFLLQGVEKESRQHNVYARADSIIAGHFFTLQPSK